MITFTLNEKNYNFPESWEEVSLKQYIRIGKIQEESFDNTFRELYLLKLIETLADAEEGELDELSLEEVGRLGEASLFASKSHPSFDKNPEIWIGETLYTPPKDFTKLSIGEFISLKTYQDGAKNIWDASAWMLAILWRPTKIVIDSESGEERREREKFKVENLEWRKDLFLTQPATKIFGPLLFFSSMSSGYIQNTEDYIQAKEKREEEDPEKSKLMEDTAG